eukprot:325065-Rhodomonas_salina.1
MPCSCPPHCRGVLQAARMDHRRLRHGQEIMPGFLRLHSRFFSWYKGRIGLSICRAAGSLGMMLGPTYSIQSRK